jgi:hypothetical protein
VFIHRELSKKLVAKSRVFFRPSEFHLVVQASQKLASDAEVIINAKVV